ncbi:MAG: hypothetical protein CR980_00175 [Propionibacteriales bacterium]|nr:MAG: hypothetical protein CR980_00175 [Propionibacteriales bacterium]
MRPRNERGLAAATEVALLVPVLLLLIGLFAAGWRIFDARSKVNAATQVAARAAAVSKTPANHLAVSSNTKALSKPAGSTGTVTVRTSCQVSLADLIVPGLPGGMTLSATGSSPISTYRQER